MSSGTKERTTKKRTADDRTWSVRELADELGVTTRTLRFYEAEGLLTPRRVGTSRTRRSPP
jgi:hypothetical protein